MALSHLSTNQNYPAIGSGHEVTCRKFIGSQNRAAGASPGEATAQMTLEFGRRQILTSTGESGKMKASRKCGTFSFAIKQQQPSGRSDFLDKNRQTEGGCFLVAKWQDQRNTNLLSLSLEESNLNAVGVNIARAKPLSKIIV